MTYSIFDTGDLVVSFNRADEAQAAFDRIVRENAEARDRLLLVAFDDEGNAIGDYAPGDRVAGSEPHLPLVASGQPALAERVDERLAGFGDR
ncbi:MAG TPA: hypothetical protein VKB25_09785 [Conexibacter sp.]|nr:hypothetical protein [Conexibacter sp.]